MPPSHRHPPHRHPPHRNPPSWTHATPMPMPRPSLRSHLGSLFLPCRIPVLDLGPPVAHSPHAHALSYTRLAHLLQPKKGVDGNEAGPGPLSAMKQYPSPSRSAPGGNPRPTTSRPFAPTPTAFFVLFLTLCRYAHLPVSRSVVRALAATPSRTTSFTWRVRWQLQLARDLPPPTPTRPPTHALRSPLSA